MFKISLHGPRLSEAADTNGPYSYWYGLGSLLQISATRALLIANRRTVGVDVVDLEDGADGFIIDTIDQIDPAQAIPLVHNEQATHPRTGQRLIMVQHCSVGGFVPLGACLSDGQPHPAAGTGFILATAVGHGADLSENVLNMQDTHSLRVVLQIRYDGRELSIVKVERYEPGQAPFGLYSFRHPLQNAIPDGEDLLTGVSIAPIDPEAGPIPSQHPHARGQFGRNRGCAIWRWRYGSDGWQPVSSVPVTGPDISAEPTLIRDTDDSLLMSVRGKGLDVPPGEVLDGLENTYEHFRVYRSTDNGQTWQPAVHLPRQRTATPVVLSRTAGGLPYLSANPYDSQPERDAQGRMVMSTRRRDHLCCWALTADRRGVSEPSRIVDATAAFGPAHAISHPALKHDNGWFLDHPIGSVLQLGDGELGTYLCFRVTDTGVNACGAIPTPEHGLYIERVTVQGDPPPAPIWRFDKR